MYMQVCMFRKGSSLTFPQGAGLSCREDRIFYLGWCPNQSEWQWWRPQWPDSHLDPTLPSVIINPYWGRVLRFNHNYLFKQHERKIKSFHKDYRICKAVQQQEKWFSIPVLVQKVHLKLTNFITQKKKKKNAIIDSYCLGQSWNSCCKIWLQTRCWVQECGHIDKIKAI